jgi:hypothetical protein
MTASHPPSCGDRAPAPRHRLTLLLVSLAWLGPSGALGAADEPQDPE